MFPTQYSIDTSNVPVSYTHLDVYKRQMLNGRNNLLYHMFYIEINLILFTVSYSTIRNKTI